MAKRRNKNPKPEPPPPAQTPAPSVDAITLITLAGLVGALLVTFASWQKVGFIEKSLDDRLGWIESQVARVVDSASRAAAQPEQPPRRGPDPDRVYDIQTVGAPVKGPPGAPITIAEFSDFQWPFCARVGPTLQQIEETYGDQVKIVWKHLPVASLHPQAEGAHLAAVAAQKQGRFWEFHDKVFANQKDLNLEAYRRYAVELDLDVERFDKDLLDLENKQVIDVDRAEAQSIQLTGTPGFFINGRYLRGAKPFEDFAQMINAELERLGLPVPAAAQAYSAGG